MKTLILVAFLFQSTTAVHAASKLDCILQDTGEVLQIKLKNKQDAEVLFHDELLKGSYTLKDEPINTRLTGFKGLGIKGAQFALNLVLRPPYFNEGFGWASVDGKDSGIDCKPQVEDLICSGLNACAWAGAIDELCTNFVSSGPMVQNVDVYLKKKGEVVAYLNGTTHIILGHTAINRHTGDSRYVPAHPGLETESENYSASLQFSSSKNYVGGILTNVKTKKSQFLVSGGVLCQ